MRTEGKKKTSYLAQRTAGKRVGKSGAGKRAEVGSYLSFKGVLCSCMQTLQPWNSGLTRIMSECMLSGDRGRPT